MGNKKKVALVAALSCRPKLLILDEPTNGLDPLMRQTLFDVLYEQRQAGCTVFLSSHNLDEVQSLCSRVAIIRDGRIVDIKELGVLSMEKAKKVTVVGEGLPDSLQNDAVKMVSTDKGKLVFTYHSADMSALLKLVQSLNVQDFLVEDLKLSDIFMSYYK
jgi:ABC-2 type transport system ATP-binding protein